jgi:hypothetical protein
VTKQKAGIRNEIPVRQITPLGFVIVDRRQSEPTGVANSRKSRARLNFCANLPVALSLTAPANYAPQRTALPGRRWALRWQALCVTEQKSPIRNETPLRQITPFWSVIVDQRQSESAEVANSRWSRARLNFCANLPVALSLTATANKAPQRTARGAPPLGFALAGAVCD